LKDCRAHFLRSEGRVGANQDNLPPLRLLIVEDESLISMLIEAMVQDLGHQAVGCAYTVPDALTMLDEQEADIDAAMLDVNLGGRLVFPVAEALAERNIPFAFLTGYGAQGVPARFSYARVMQKPITEDEFADVMALLQRERFAGLCGRA
jgi:CheY-like chemotaxis protein